MGELAADLLRLAMGGGGFAWSVWALVTVMLVAMAAALVTLARPVVDPVVTIVALQPGRMVVWAFLSLVVVPFVSATLAATIIAAPLAVIFLLALPIVGLLGYIAIAMVLADRIARFQGLVFRPWLAAALGVLAFRLVRLVPAVGAPLHSLVCWLALGAAMALLWDLGLSWHRRRMPDEEQFATPVIEWDPDHGPVPHDPSRRPPT